MFRVKTPAATPAAEAVKATAVSAAGPASAGNYFFQRKLQYQCHNGRSFQRFSAANGEVLASYLCHYFPNHAEAIRLNKAPSLTAHNQTIAGVMKPSVSQMLPPVHEQYFVGRDYIETVLNSKVRADAPPPCVLPLPEVTHLHQQVISGAMKLKDVEDMLQPREVYHISSVEGFEHYDWSRYGFDSAMSEITAKFATAEKKAADAAGAADMSDKELAVRREEFQQLLLSRKKLNNPLEYSNSAFKITLPRDALTGNYFQREELVDNLMAASRHFNYENCFWLRSTHPQLHKYLKLAPPAGAAGGGGGGGGATIGSSVDALAGGGTAVGGQDYDSYVGNVPCLTMSLSSVVFFLEDLQPKFPVQFLHQSLVPDPNSPHVAGKQLSTSYDLLTNASQIKRGMNAATGFVSTNPYFTAPSSSSGVLSSASHSPSGVWLSLDQVLRYGLTLKDGRMPVLMVDESAAAATAAPTPAPAAAASSNGKKAKAEKKPKKEPKKKAGKKGAAVVEDTPIVATPTTTLEGPYSKRHQQWSGNGRLIEVEEWELYNAAQLSVPGRVALKQAAYDESVPKGLFE